MFTTLKRITSAGLKTFWRNSLLSSSSILTVTITLITSIMIFLAIVVGDAKLKDVEKKVDVNIYFTADAPIEKVLEFKKEFKRVPEIDLEKTKLITKEEALVDFKESNKWNTSMAEVLDIIGENPLGAVINLKAKNIEGYKTIIEFLESDVIQAKYLSIIDSTNYNENKYVIGKITTLIKYITIIGLGVAGILIFISLIIIYNTIRLIIYSYKEEIQVMRLIGASNFYTRGPFLIEGILYGLISGIFSIFATWAIIFYSTDLLKQVSNLDLNGYFSDNIWEISGSLILGGIIISFISTYFTVAKYLKIKNKR